MNLGTSCLRQKEYQRLELEKKPATKAQSEALCAEAISYDFTKSENWRRVWDEVRTYIQTTSPQKK